MFKQIGSFVSQVLVLGFPDAGGGVVLVAIGLRILVTHLRGEA